MNSMPSLEHGFDPDSPAVQRRLRWRLLKDHILRHLISFGGISVIIAIVLIFFYLAWEVYPLFRPAEIDPQENYPFVNELKGAPRFLATEEQAEVGTVVTDAGEVLFFHVADGKPVKQVELPLGEGGMTSFAEGRLLESGLMVAGTGKGEALLFKRHFEVTYPGDKRLITPSVTYPYGEELHVLDPEGHPLRLIALANDEDNNATLVGVTDDDRLVFTRFAVEENLMGEREVEQVEGSMPRPDHAPVGIAVSGLGEWLFVADDAGWLTMYDLRDPDDIKVADRKEVGRNGREVTAMRMLMGGISVLIGYSDGSVEQWFPVRDDNNRYHLAHVRDFRLGDSPVRLIEPERQRKGFAAADEAGNLGIFYTTSERRLLDRRMPEGIRLMAISPRSDHMLLLDQKGRMDVWAVHNEHPEVSWKALWGKVWYEGYQKPEFIWQSSAANQDFEPKLSLTPLAFGTFKAAFYAMIVAMPLAILGAIYTGYFMAPQMRRLIKPTIEIMEALPTVILGFLAGLWLAPFLELHLPGVVVLMLMMPVGILVASYLWSRLPMSVRALVPEGWVPALLIPVVAFIAWLSFAVSLPIEEAFFDGNFVHWLTDSLGVDFDQRNSIVIGFAMGFAVIPTIFSITEDAIFGVPKHLTTGSLALGATPWQTLVRVVLPSASPGIFSGTMIGLGRAVGETMIVLMATGNTPVMDMNIFEGMRTLSANIAVEMPEAEVASTHFRVLFLAALVLFLATFLFNTGAELVRQRLRNKYARL
ncbi:MAG: ABC transporter permease subunit [Gammaproteobacteria bacterium]|nr:MAG: ABC transporter permease subunit [Gammaproteobacteria bacterium]